MTRIKKSRKEKTIGPSNKPLDKKSDRKAALAKKKGKGRPAGSRIQDSEKKKTTGKGKTSGQAVDSRHGSKKPVALVVETKQAPMQPKASLKKIKQPQEKSKNSTLTPEQELAQLENNTRLNTLLDKLDDNQSISAAEQQYVDRLTARHLVLLKELGLVEEDEEEQADDIWSQFDGADLDSYKED